MTMLIINTVELAYASNIEYTVDDDNTRIVVRSKAALPNLKKMNAKIRGFGAFHVLLLSYQRYA